MLYRIFTLSVAKRMYIRHKVEFNRKIRYLQQLHVLKVPVLGCLPSRITAYPPQSFTSLPENVPTEEACSHAEHVPVFSKSCVRCFEVRHSKHITSTITYTAASEHQLEWRTSRPVL